MPTDPSFHHFHVQHFCPVAQTLERVGDRWSWLIVRDLMRGPQRFSDLQRYLAGITPKRLTINLRTLEVEGIVERQREQGRREVWYRLSAKGQGLVPVIEALRSWSIEYNLRAPLPGETVHPEHMMGVVSFALNQRGLRLAQPVKWTLSFGAKSVFTIHFDGEQWSTQPSDEADADVHIETTPATWAAFVVSRSAEECQRLLSAMRISGEPARVNELLAITWSEQQPLMV
ncbi:MAG TPA: helix-turn-helix domain-containing protein [Roseiflexaceae bacterium]|nr:helix-turn-helix domain-containing protein [Roseiflexaceae bacterium]